uniref:hypothetical protein n=1 Tax=Sulfuriferula sp. GW6 TaxID=3345112 RepID=UPI0039F6B758
MKRKDALVLIRVAGYHADKAAFTRLYVENRVSREAANAEYQRGQEMKKAGVPCQCRECAPKP